jgi:hypothetical protein
MKQKHDISINVFFTIILLLGLGMIIYGIFHIHPLPLVLWSTSRDECVEVRYYDTVSEQWESCDCEDMPEKYEKVWVQ